MGRNQHLAHFIFQKFFIAKNPETFSVSGFFYLAFLIPKNMRSVDKKDATLKMAKLLIYQGFTALFRLFFKVFFVFVLPLVKNKELTKKMPFPTKELTKKMPLLGTCDKAGAQSGFKNKITK